MRLKSRTRLITAMVAIGTMVGPSTQASATIYRGAPLGGPNHAPAAALAPPSVNSAPSAASRMICTPRSEPMACRPISSLTGSPGSSSEFQLGDAAIGAGVVAGIGLLGLAAAPPTRRRSQLRLP